MPTKKPMRTRIRTFDCDRSVARNHAQARRKMCIYASRQTVGRAGGLHESRDHAGTMVRLSPPCLAGYSSHAHSSNAQVPGQYCVH